MLRSFFSRIIVIGAFLHLYVGLRLIPATQLAVPWQILMGAWLAASLVLIPLGARRRDGGATGLRAFGIWVGLIEMGFFSFLLTLTVLRDIVLGLFALASYFSTALAATMPYSTLRTASADWVIVWTFLLTLIAVYNARRRAPIVRVDIPIEGLPTALHGFTIAQISDIHVGPTIRKRYLDPIVDAVNGLKADMVAITGDVVDGSVAALSEHTRPLSRLTGRHGVFLCTGNHEYYAGANAWIAEFRRLGIRVLMNEHVVLDHDGMPLVLAGVTDYSADRFSAEHRSDPAKAIAGAPTNAEIRVLLAHQPRSAAAAAKAGFTLQLSGHTHGGQFFPWNFAVRMQQPFTAGLVRSSRMWMYISRGTGYWGPPLRLAAPSEITHIRLIPGMSPAPI